MATVNPYLAPDADLSVETTGSSTDKIKQLPRFTTWAVFGLGSITMGGYAIYWLYSRTKTLNGLLSENKIPAWLPTATLVSYAVNIVSSFAPLAMSSNPELAMMAAGVSVISSIVYIVLFIMSVFAFRKRINILSESTKGDSSWLGGILTFFLNVYYFQYKINQMHDRS